MSDELLPGRRAYGTGSLYFRERDGKWVYQREFGPDTRGRRVRRTASAATPEEALAKGEGLTYDPKRPRRKSKMWSKKHQADHTTARERRTRATQFVTFILEESRRHSWSDELLARIIIATLTPTRVRRGILGPCAYCGDWTANQIDHVVPIARGGSDEPDNLVSACISCNSKKGDRTPEEWAA